MNDGFTGNLADCPELQPRAEHRRWTSHAEAFFTKTDHLVQVAGIAAASGTSIHKLAGDSFEKLVAQARLQCQARANRIEHPHAPPSYEVLPHAGRNGEPLGLAALPPPITRRMFFFDMEGYPFVSGGLEYLFGASTLAEEAGKFAFNDWWAHDHEAEKLALEGFVDWVYDRWKKNLGMHICHYAAYEVSAVRRLSTRHDTRPDQVDELLRNEVFVDRYQIVSHGLRIGEDSYSIKKVERLCRPKRAADVATAVDSIVQYGSRSCSQLLATQSEAWRSSGKLEERGGRAQISCNQPSAMSQEAGVMTIKVNPDVCPKCGATIPTDAPQGLCPQCVLLGAASTVTGLAPTATAEIPSCERVAAAFPQLEILELLGRGGMGFVFKARQPQLDRFVALKLLPAKLARDPHFAERFSREARALARLNHPGIVTIYDFGQAGGFYFLLMEYVDGVNLRQAMRAGRFSPAAALAVVPRICEALQFAHEQGVLHRDIKPENILLDTKGRVKIADFGIAKLVGDEKPELNLTATGATIGTPHYMAPEQLEQPGTVDHRADIYSLGVVFYELLTGELPIGRFSPPSQRTPLDPRVDEVVMRTLEKEREKRFQSAGEVKTNVEHLTKPQGASTVAVPAFDPSQDFILCPPRLPRMAKAIVVYALVVAPVLWLVSLFTLESLPDHALVAFVEGTVNLVSSAGEFLVLVALAVGGWRLRALRPSAPTWLKCSLWSHLTLIVLAIGGHFWVGVLEVELLPNAPAPPLNVGDGLMLAIALASVVFEISALVWLRRRGALLKSFCSSGRAAKGPQGTLVISSGTAPKWRGRILRGIACLLILGAVGLVSLVTMLNLLDHYLSAVAEKGATPPPRENALTGTNTVAWIQFTFTAVELREVDGKHWLAIDYLDNMHGNCEKSFPWETKMPGVRPEVRTSEFAKDPQDPSAPRHQRIEYRLPDSRSRESVEQLRNEVEKALKQKTIRLEPGQEKLLFEFGRSGDTALKAWIKVTPALKHSP